MFSSRERGGGGRTAIAGLQARPFSNYLSQGRAPHASCKQPSTAFLRARAAGRAPADPADRGHRGPGSRHLRARCGRVSPRRNRLFGSSGSTASPVRAPARAPSAAGTSPRRRRGAQPLHTVPSPPARHRPPIGGGKARGKERERGQKAGRGVTEANKKNKTTERLLHSPRLNYKPVY